MLVCGALLGRMTIWKRALAVHVFNSKQLTAAAKPRVMHCLLIAREANRLHTYFRKGKALMRVVPWQLLFPVT